MATISSSDIYPGAIAGTPPPKLTTAKPDASSGKASNKAPAMMWVGILIALVALRVVYEVS